MFQVSEITQDALNAEVNYRREQLTGTTYPGSRVRRMRHRRNRSRDAA